MATKDTGLMSADWQPPKDLRRYQPGDRVHCHEADNWTLKAEELALLHAHGVSYPWNPEDFLRLIREIERLRHQIINLEWAQEQVTEEDR